MDKEEFKQDIIKSMDLSYDQLRKVLDPIFHDKTRYLNGKPLKDIFKYIKEIIQCHHYLRRQI